MLSPPPFAGLRMMLPPPLMVICRPSKLMVCSWPPGRVMVRVLQGEDIDAIE
jgi:hypothetical protein